MTPLLFPIVGIGASAGGLQAFTQVLEFLPATTGMAFVYVQHLDPTHESLLSELLAKVTTMPVQQVTTDLRVEPDHVYVLSPQTDLTIAQGMLKPQPRRETNGLHLPIDTFFRSLAAQQRHLAIGVVLSGTASDGTLGLKAIQAAGGMTFAQDATASSPGMPQSALAAGAVDALLSPKGIASELLRISHNPSLQSSHAAEADDVERTEHELPEEERESTEQEHPDEERAFRQILFLLHQRTGVNFATYKPLTLKRRILRRLTLQKQESVAEYADFLREHASEVELLYQDMLINVTSFFRDPLVFEVLTRDIFPALLRLKAPGDPLRIWVVGCSTGEEVYSLAICLLESCAAHSITPPIHFFGTDIDDVAIRHARTGHYLPGALEGVSPERRERFFLWVDGHYQIRKSVRDVCVFAHHNVCTDPPFSRVDLLSCRNLLIYLGAAMQKKVMRTFQYALNPHGFLLLGSSETVGADSSLFMPVEKKLRVYTKKANSGGPIFEQALSHTEREQRDQNKEDPMGLEGIVEEVDPQKEADALLLANYVPASVVIDETMEVQHFRGSTTPYLQPAPGKASFNVFKMAHETLKLPLRAAIHQARTSGQRVRKEGIELSALGVNRQITVEVLPLKGGSFLVLFEEMPMPSPAIESEVNSQVAKTKTRDAKDRQIASLAQELAATRGDIRSVVEELEAANEKLQAANEEILSSNEEMQSLNEELETSKEEIQASNEELLVLNQELHQRNEDLTAAGAYTDAIIETLREPFVILNTTLRVQQANASFYSFFQVTPAETEQHYLSDLGSQQWNLPRLRVFLENMLLENHAVHDFEVEQVFPSIGHKVLLLNARRVFGTQSREALILLAFEDVTERRELERHKDAFLAIASHELKTPITSLKVYAQLLRRQYTKAGDEQAAHKLEVMEKQANRLTHLIGQLLDTTQLQAKSPLLQSRLFMVPELIQSVLEDVQRTTQTHQISLEGSIHEPFWGDPERMSQVLTNLLSNAIKYSPESGAIQVRLKEESDAVIVSVQDFGMGIPAEKQAYLFERFYRVNDATQTAIPGLGLGLYISAEIVKQHGGQMWVESREGEGTTFFARFVSLVA